MSDVVIVAIDGYVCAGCGLFFKRTTSNEEMMAEARTIFTQAEIETGPLEIVCDDCFRGYMSWSAPRQNRVIPS